VVIPQVNDKEEGIKVSPESHDLLLSNFSLERSDDLNIFVPTYDAIYGMRKKEKKTFTSL